MYKIAMEKSFRFALQVFVREPKPCSRVLQMEAVQYFTSKGFCLPFLDLDCIRAESKKVALSPGFACNQRTCFVAG